MYCGIFVSRGVFEAMVVFTMELLVVEVYCIDAGIVTTQVLSRRNLDADVTIVQRYTSTSSSLY